jgi:hypothetical protein
MKSRLAPFAIGLIAVSLAGAAIRWSVTPVASDSNRAAQLDAERRAAERSLPLAYLALAAAGCALMLADRWTERAAGGLLIIASGLLANLAEAYWLAALLIAVPLLLIASVGTRSS